MANVMRHSRGEHYNEKHPHSALKYHSPREFRRSMDSATLV